MIGSNFSIENFLNKNMIVTHEEKSMLPSTDSKIVVITLLALAILMISCVYRIKSSHSIKEIKNEKSHVCLKIQKTQILSQPFLMLENKKKIPAVCSSILPSLPEMDYDLIFKQLSQQTPNPISIPYKDWDTNSRFEDIQCPRETLVNFEGVSDDFYLHANHVQLANQHFIAAQYPLVTHFNIFWQISRQVCLIVDLTNENDMKKDLIAYAPTIKSTMSFENFSLTCIETQPIEELNAYLYAYQLSSNHENGQKQEDIECKIPRLHYKGWPDHHGITEDDLDKLIEIIQIYQKASTKPVLIHCRAGVGRTGTLTVACVLKDLIERKQVNASNLIEHLTRLILEGRKQRGRCFVQTKSQLEALCKWSWRFLHRMQYSNTKFD